jgi:hypothetical protein
MFISSSLQSLRKYEYPKSNLLFGVIIISQGAKGVVCGHVGMHTNRTQEMSSTPTKSYVCMSMSWLLRNMYMANSWKDKQQVCDILKWGTCQLKKKILIKKKIYTPGLLHSVTENFLYSKQYGIYPNKVCELGINNFKLWRIFNPWHEKAGWDMRQKYLSIISNTKSCQYIRFEVFTAVTMKNGVFWDVTPCGMLRRNTKYFFAACVSCQLQLVLFLVHRFLSPWWRRR